MWQLVVTIRLKMFVTQCTAHNNNNITGFLTDKKTFSAMLRQAQNATTEKRRKKTASKVNSLRPIQVIVILHNSLKRERVSVVVAFVCEVESIDKGIAPRHIASGLLAFPICICRFLPCYL